MAESLSAASAHEPPKPSVEPSAELPSPPAIARSVIEVYNLGDNGVPMFATDIDDIQGRSAPLFDASTVTDFWNSLSERQRVALMESAADSSLDMLAGLPLQTQAAVRRLVSRRSSRL